jgi:hypothetical protein
VDGFALSPAERAFFQALADRQVRYLVIGLSAAVLDGAPVATQDIDVWFEQLNDPAIRDAIRSCGGFYLNGFGIQPPAFGGDGFERLDIVLTAHGLESFAAEFERSRQLDVDGVKIPVLPLERIIVSKRATGRAKDLASLPALEATLAARRRKD